MAATHKHARRGVVSSGGSETPKRKERQSLKAVSVEPAVQVAPAKPDIYEPILPRVEAIITPPPMASPTPPPMASPTPPPMASPTPPPMASPIRVLGLAKKPMPESPAPTVKLMHSPVAAVNSAPEYLKSLARERTVWGVAVAVSWMVTMVALLRLAGVI